MNISIHSVGFEGFPFEAFQFTVALAAAVTAADKGAPMAIDATAANTLKVAGDGDPIVAKLLTFEDRQTEGNKLGTATFKFTGRFKAASGSDISVGDTVVGAGGGEVKEAAANDPNVNFVAEIDGDEVIVCKF